MPHRRGAVVAQFFVKLLQPGDGALLRVINFPARGIGNRSLEQLQDAAATQGVSLWQAAKAKAESAVQPTSSPKGVAGGDSLRWYSRYRHASTAS